MNNTNLARDNNSLFLVAMNNKRAENLIPVIPDIKCFSPKEGDLMRGRDPIRFAREMESAGACALSVVTEKESFHGSMELLRKVCRTVHVPVLRKDFLKTTSDLLETKEAGAAAVLLMYSCLGKSKLDSLYREAIALNLLPLVETHTKEELLWAADLQASLIGINNKDILLLERDDGNVSCAEALLKNAPKGAFIIVESGLRNGADVRRAIRSGAGASLVGTAILNSESPEALFRSMARPCDLKICGLMDKKGVDLCLKYYIDVLGFVTEYPVNVPWNLSRKQANDLVSYVKRKTKNGLQPPKTCIVTGGSPDKVLALAKEIRPDMVQLHYTETLKETSLIAAMLNAEHIQTVRSVPSDKKLRQKMFGTQNLADIAEELKAAGIDYMLLDSRNASNATYGGKNILQEPSVVFAQRLLRGSNTALMVGGGLSANNIREAVSLLSPDCIDVMTGVEDAPGQKSEKLLKELIHAIESRKGGQPCQKDDLANTEDSISRKR